MIDSGEVAMNCYGREVEVCRIRKKPVLFLFSADNPPPITRTVTQELQKNRRNVKSGKVVGWDNHGYVAILESSSGLQAAFHSSELEYSRVSRT